MMERQYEALDSEQSSRAAALEIAATHTAEVVEHLDHTSKYGSVKDAPKGGLRGVFSQIVDGEPPKGSTEFSESSFNTFGDVDDAVRAVDRTGLRHGQDRTRR